MEKFLSALEEVAMFVEPNMVITERHISEYHNGHSTFRVYQINGYDSVTEDSIGITSNGYIAEDKGQQVMVTKGNTTRMFPFFGFNWTYLKSNK